LIPFLFFPENFLGHISAFSNFEAKRAKIGAKNKKNEVSKSVLDLNFAPITVSVFF
jgi:hypothetical protein